MSDGVAALLTTLMFFVSMAAWVPLLEAIRRAGERRTESRERVAVPRPVIPISSVIRRTGVAGAR